MVPGRDHKTGITPAIPARGPRLWALMTLALFTLGACVLDKEEGVRAQLAGWMVLGDPVYFNSQRDCTAALYEAKRIKSGVRSVQDVDRGLRLIRQGRVVAFDIAGLSPADVQRAVDVLDRPTGLAILVSGLVARDCYGDALRGAFSDTLLSRDAVLLFDPANNAVGLFERGDRRVFYSRGEV